MRQTIGQLLRPVAGRDRVVWRALRAPRLRYAVFRNRIDCIIYGLLVSRPLVFFIQIGSNDGRTGDWLWTFRRHRSWSGILVEPVEAVFGRLQENYAPWETRFRFERSAVGKENGSRPFYCVEAAEGSTLGGDQLGSLDEQLVRRHAQQVLGEGARVMETTVNCVTLRELCRKHDVRSLDLLAIDAEGVDYQILQQLDWDQYSPSLVLYEHVHLSPADRRCALALLARMGYQVASIGGDTIAVRQKALSAMPLLRKAWKIVLASADRDSRSRSARTATNGAA